MSSQKSSRVLDEWTPGDRLAEEFRTLGTKVRLAGNDASLRTICVTSPSQSEGKTFVLANLAIALARTGMKVIAIDADLRHPRLHVVFGIDQGQGLSTFLAGKGKNASSASNVKLTEVKGVQILTSGSVPEDPIGLLSSPKFKELLEAMSQKADLVLVDCPPVLPVADASILASNVDGVLLILRANQTNNRAARDAVENLAKVNARFVGVVLNAAAASNDQYSRYYSRTKKNLRPLEFAFRQAQNVLKAVRKKATHTH
jgi:capsular exopolysaccharide synthesis family protein